MRTTLDAAGRVAIPRALRERLGLTPGTQLDLEVRDGRLTLSIASKVWVEETPHGPRLAANAPAAIRSEEVRALIERSRS